MRKGKHGWEWTLGMAAAICLLGVAAGPGTAGFGEQQEPPRIQEAWLQGGVRVSVQKAPADSKEATEERPLLSLHSQSAVLMDGKSGRVLYGKSEDLKRPMASTTKIMTCILALENAALGDTVTASEKAASQPQVRMGMKEGEQYFLKDLLYALMLESYNDSAVAIAEHIGGSVEGFAKMMNEKAKDLGCESTYFITPNGLDAQETDENGEEQIHSTTARDLARIMAYCVLESPKREEFLDITRTRNYSFTDKEGKRSISCVNHNALLDMDTGLMSGKTGFTGDAGYSYVAAAEDDGRIFTIALLGCGWPPDKTWKWSDAKKLLEYGRDYYAYRDVYREQKFDPVPVQEGVPADQDLSHPAQVALEMDPDESLNVLMAQDEEADITVKVPQSLSAPVEKGETVGEVVYSLEGKILERFPVNAAESVEKITLPWCLERIIEEYLL